MLSLQTLPLEMLGCVTVFCDPKDASSLARVNSRFFEGCNRVLYLTDFRKPPCRKSCMLWAIHRGKLDTVRRALSYGVDLKIYDKIRPPFKWPEPTYLGKPSPKPEEPVFYAAPPLHIVAKLGHVDIAETLLDYGTVLDAPSREMCNCLDYEQRMHIGGDLPAWYPLHTAMAHGSHKVAEGLVERGAYLEARSSPALVGAVIHGALGVVDTLLDHPAINPHRRDTLNESALHHVSECTNRKVSRSIVFKLARRGINVETVGARGRPLHLAALRRNFEVALALLDNGANPLAEDETDLEGYNVLHHCLQSQGAGMAAYEYETPKEIEIQRLELVSRLVQAGVDVHAASTNGLLWDGPPLFFAAAAAQNVRCMKLLLEAGARTQVVVIKKETEMEMELPLIRAVLEQPTFGSRKAFRLRLYLLLHYGASLDPLGSESSALEYACECHAKKDPWLLRLLLRKGTCRNVSAAHVKWLLLKYSGVDRTHEVLSAFLEREFPGEALHQGSLGAQFKPLGLLTT